jgi:gamma-glutamyltranspeptidase/glutathione hydrolase
VFREGQLRIAGNTPGGHYQVQTNLQILSHILDYGLDPQAAVDAARWGHSGSSLLVEDHMPAETIAGLRERGHDVTSVGRSVAPMGRAQVIMRGEPGVLMGGSDTRGEGSAAGY